MTVFADTSYFIALVSRDDDAHADAVRHTEEFSGDLVTTEWVLNEFANFLAKPPNRQLFVQMFDELKRHPRVRIVPCSDASFGSGSALYASRLDKEWSITDCISFLVMNQQKIEAALTKDHHFEQAGSRCIL